SMPEDKWLTTTEAAERLGVHPATIRRWADEGDLPMMMTPGGHRRFALSDIEELASAGGNFELVSFESRWAEHALVHTRDQIQEHKQQEWMRSFSEDERIRSRELGRRLLGLMLRYVSMQNGGEELLEEVRQIGHAYAEEAKAADMPLNQAMEVAMFFRDGMIDTTLDIPHGPSVGTQSYRHLLKRLNPVLNALQLAIVEAYQETGA
ncbi:MAG: MerR family transcriptional regulator, partial [Anaerolineales bacterium]